MRGCGAHAVRYAIAATPAPLQGSQRARKAPGGPRRWPVQIG